MKLEFFAVIGLLLVGSSAGYTQSNGKKGNDVAVSGKRVLWKEPSDIASRNLFWGPGGEAHSPQGPFTFLKEDAAGSNPKFEITDRDGVKWKAKLGREAKPETVASRLVWAAGYSADEDYFLPTLKVEDMPKHLHRGQNLIKADGVLSNVRLKRARAGRSAGSWKWKDNPFRKTQEGNGLRVLMALLNNWDLKDENNVKIAVAKSGADGELVYMVSDLGATFGTTGFTLMPSRSRGNLAEYSQSAFISKIREKDIDFATPGSASILMFLMPGFYKRLALRPIGDHIQKVDAKWMGEILGRLSASQIEDAFRAAAYGPEDAAKFREILQKRIQQLKAL